MQPRGCSLSLPILDIVGQDPSVSKSNRLTFYIFRFIFINFEVFSIDSSRKIGIYLKLLNFNQSFHPT